MTKKRIWLALVLALALTGAVFAAACAGDKGETPGVEGAVEGGTLAIYIGEPSFITPDLAFESEGIQVMNAIYDTLTTYDPMTLELKPEVAESWEANADATVWTFHLKQGTKFHNGREVVAADFKYAWERLSNSDLASNYGSLLNMVAGYQEYWDKTATEITGIKAVDDYTLEVTMAAPFAEFPYICGFVDTAPMPKEEVDGKEDAYALKPIGNGPFMMAEDWVAGQYIKVVKVPDYTGAKPYLDGIDFKIYNDINTAWTDFQAGSLDWTSIPTGNYRASIEQYGESTDGNTSNPGNQVQTGPELAIYEMLFNNNDPVMQNIELRKAISLAINRQAICDTVYEGARQPATSPIPPGIPGYEANSWQYCKYDVEAARAALEAAGYPGGEGLPVLKLTFNSGAGHDDLMQLVQSDLAAIGIQTEFDTSDGPTYWSKVDADEFQIGRSGWQCDYPTIDDYLSPLYYSTGGCNFSNYNVPEIDAAIDAARALVDDDERIAAFQQIVRDIGDDCPETIVAVYAHARVSSARVHNLIYSSMGLLDFDHVYIAE
jgi:peptide/nickel transport system substrate-binding protein/oligopeptide transport system substrate-binding protein